MSSGEWSWPMHTVVPWLIVAAAIAIDVSAALFLIEHSAALSREIGGDRAIYIGAAERWMDGGSFYPQWQLDGPYIVEVPAVLYPPTMLPLFAAFAFLPAILWWVLPLGFTASVVVRHRPGPWRIAGIAACLAVPVSWTVLLNGTPTIWFMAAVAAATTRTWPFALLFAKPTLAPLALLGIRDRGWWLALVALGLVSLAFLPLWRDWIVTISNARGPDATPLYSIHDLPLLAIPLIAALGPGALPDRISVLRTG